MYKEVTSGGSRLHCNEAAVELIKGGGGVKMLDPWSLIYLKDKRGGVWAPKAPFLDPSLITK